MVELKQYMFIIKNGGILALIEKVTYSILCTREEFYFGSQLEKL